MIKRTVLTLLLTSFVAAMAFAAPAEWPKSKPGAMAKAWIEAFNGGEKQMRGFLEKNVTAESLVQRPMEQRLSTYRDLKKKFGSLKLEKVTSETENAVEATLVDADDKTHEATIEIQKDAPFKLKSVKLTMQQAHDFFGLHH